MKRRSFLTGLIAAPAAPLAIKRATVPAKIWHIDPSGNSPLMNLATDVLPQNFDGPVWITASSVSRVGTWDDWDGFDDEFDEYSED